MNRSSSRSRRRLLAVLNFSGLDRIYQQLGDEMGMILCVNQVSDQLPTRFEPNAHLRICPEFLESVVKLLIYRQIDIISLGEAVERLSSGFTGENRFAVLTFDHGYRDCLDHAIPILRKYDLPYTFFVCPGLIEDAASIWWKGVEELVRQQERILVKLPGGMDGPHELNCTTTRDKYDSYELLIDHLKHTVFEEDQHRAVRELCWLYRIDLDELTKDLILDWSGVHRLVEDTNCTIGTHSLNHKALSRLTPQDALEEMKRGADILQAELGFRPRHFSYPFGDSETAGDREFSLAREIGFDTAVTNRPGMLFAGHCEHLHALPRIALSGAFQKLRYFAPLTTGLPSRLGNGLRRLHTQ